ncbi:MAG: phosphate ABC transporter substrate-binding protein [Pirellulales bacterium]|nr:phosphate ABC transporter substrate-binding protein [Pirellulales bacterium]
MMNRFLVFTTTAGVLLVAGFGCGSRGVDREQEQQSGGAGVADATTIRVEGSDTMVNLAQAWAENYHQKHTYMSVQVQGGGTGVGIASLTDGNCDMANASREISEKEARRIAAHRGAKPVKHVAGYDALAIYVHKDNPIDAISLEELAEIYGEGGKITNWKQLGGKDLEITRVSRQNNSGTYEYFREAVLGHEREYKLGSIDQSGSKDLVALVSKTPGAIGYSGMGYHTPDVKMLKVAKTKGGEAVAPTVENAQDGSYPITRPLYIYTVGELQGPVKDYLDWILAAEGQQVVRDLGYVPVAGSSSAADSAPEAAKSGTEPGHSP